DAGVTEQRPVDRMVVMRMGEQDVGHVLGLQATLLQPLDQEPPHAERAGVDQRHPAVAAQQDDAAPAQATMAYRLPREALDDDIDVVRGLAHHAAPRGGLAAGGADMALFGRKSSRKSG